VRYSSSGGICDAPGYTGSVFLRDSLKTQSHY
jgi:hypothetical protein